MNPQESKTPLPDWPVDAVRPSARAECAALAVFELALERPTGRPTSARKIAEKYGLSERFLTQTLQRLRRFGVVETARGSFGGFRLLLDPTELTLGFVVALAETDPSTAEKNTSNASTPDDAPLPAFGKNRAVDKRRKNVSSTTPDDDANATRALFDRAWQEAENKRQEFLNSILFSDLVANARPKAPYNFTI